MDSRKAGARHRRGSSPPIVSVVLALAFVLPTLAWADDVEELRHPDGRPGVWMTAEAYLDGREEHLRLGEVRLQLARAEERAVTAAADSERLSDALAVTHRALAQERDRWPWSTWLVLGACGTLLVEAVVVGLVLWAD